MSNTSNQKRYPDNCRVFIGNLDNKAPGASKSNLTKIFEQYGTLVEEGYAFAQYGDTKSALDAIKGENGRQIGQKAIDVSLANGGKKSSKKSPPRETGQKRDRNTSFGSEDRSSNKKTFSSSPPRNSFNPYSKSTNPYSIPSYESINVIPVYCIHTALKDYANSVAKIFSKYGIHLDLQFISRHVFQQTIDDSIKRKDRYTMYINRKNEETGTVSFRAIHPNGTSPGTADIPPIDAVNFILKNEKDYAQLSNNFPKNNYYSVPIQQPTFIPTYPIQNLPVEQSGVYIPYLPQQTQQIPNKKEEVWKDPNQTSDSTNPEVQKLLTNLLMALQQEGGSQQERVVENQSISKNEHLQFTEISKEDTSNSIPNSVLNILNSLNKN